MNTPQTPMAPSPREPTPPAPARESVGLGTSSDFGPLTSGTLKTRKATALQKAAAHYQRHKLPHPGAMTAALWFTIRMVFGVIFTRVEFDPHVQDKIRQASADGGIVYVFQTTSWIDYLYFNWAFLKYGLPLAEFANGTSTMLLHSTLTFLKHLFYKRQRTGDAYDMAAFQHNVQQGRPVWLYLERPLHDREANMAFSQPYFLRLMELHREVDRPLIIAPLLLVWDKRPDGHQPSLIDDLFGTSQAPGFFRKLLQFLNMSWQSFFIFGAPVVQVSTPIHLSEFRDEIPEADTAESAELLRDKLKDVFTQARQVVMGPPLQAANHLKRDVLRKQATGATIREVAALENVPEREVRQRAKEQLNEIAAEQSLLWTKALGAILSPVFYLIYRGFHIDMKGLQKLRDVAPGSRVILIPSHKSHIDYLVLSYVFYKYGLMPPHIAAGVNLSFWPIGPFFRRCGAFFLRRTFKGDPLYPTIFRQYLVKLLEEGVMIEFFIEGTRSRTGKVIKPRFGMLRMILDAFIEGRFDELYFQPLSIGYEKVIEGSSYRREAMGAEKKAESATSLLKASSVLTSNYGRVYIEFAEPISAKDYLKRYDIDLNQPDESALQQLVVRLGHRIVYDIAEVTPVTPTALVALVLLNASHRGLGAEQFLRDVGFALHLLLDPGRNARLSRPLQEAIERDRAASDVFARLQAGQGRAMRHADDRDQHDKALALALEPVLRQAALLLNRNDLIELREQNNALFYQATSTHLSELNYLKNNIIHFFVPEALLATAFLPDEDTHHAPLEEVRTRSLFLSRLFKYEFFYKERQPDDVESTQFDAAFNAAMNYMLDCGHITSEDIDGQTHLCVVESHRQALEFFRSLLVPYLIPYSFVANHLDIINERKGGIIESKDLLKTMLKRARETEARSELGPGEALTKQGLANVVQLLTEMGILTLEFIPGRRGKTQKHHRIHPDWRHDDRWKTFAGDIDKFTQPPRRHINAKL